jgi:hypothetical protein
VKEITTQSIALSLENILGRMVKITQNEPIQVRSCSLITPNIAILFAHGAAKNLELHDVIVLIDIVQNVTQQDISTKIEMYASAGFEAFWLVDTATQTVKVHRYPRSGKYFFERDYTIDEAITLESLNSAVKVDVLMRNDER